MILLRGILITIGIVCIKLSTETCPREVSRKGITITWHETPSGQFDISDPPCYHNNKLVRRYCNNSDWLPPHEKLRPCRKVVDYFNLSSCPPGYHAISETSNNYCYHITESSHWNYPCFESGGGSVITELNKEEINDLLQSLATKNISNFFWLPAQRIKVFNPVVWYIPGPNWGRPFDETPTLDTQTTIFKNCLLLDVEKHTVVTETCNKEYPSLCFYLNDLRYPAQCPQGYHAFRFMPDNATCFGIEQAPTETGLTYEDFLQEKCKQPIGDNEYNDLTRFIFKKIAELNNLPNDVWCWFETLSVDGNFSDPGTNNTQVVVVPSYESVINNDGALKILTTSTSTKLSCMACEIKMIYEETALSLEYNHVDTKLYLTIYFPSGLWKYDQNDKGIQCFSNAKGFVNVIDVNKTPYIVVEGVPREQYVESTIIEKSVYLVDLVTNSFAQYWCEGHTKNFTLLSTDKIVASPQKEDVHVFSLVLNATSINAGPSTTVLNGILDDVSEILNIETVLISDIFEFTTEYVFLLIHLHVPIENIYENDANNILNAFHIIQEKIDLHFSSHNFTFINMSSSIYCLPTVSIDPGNTILEWELTFLGHIAAPKQFCLQKNGLPVNRLCEGSFELGAVWGNVDGRCDQRYEPSQTTSFLYNFIKGHGPENLTARFLTEGLDFVLGDVNIIIPADIYYLSMSLQHVLNYARATESPENLGDINNMAWAMDRVMVLNNQYLRLSQTLNSTNVILDTVTDLIEMIHQHSINQSTLLSHCAYQLATQPQFVVQISYPAVNDITGIAIVKNGEFFNDFDIKPLYKNTTIDEVLTIENLEVATWIPDKVLKSLKRISNDSDNVINEEDVHIVINVFHNDAVFQQLDTTKHIINSRIIGMSIPGFISNLEHAFPILFKEVVVQHTGKKFCGFWNFDVLKSGNNPGFWSDKGCYYVTSKNNITVCKCYHMTHFGELFDIGSIVNPKDDIKDEIHLRVLNIITLIGSFMSLMGIFGIWVTALVFQTWRKKASTKVLLQLSTSIALPLIFLLVFNIDNFLFSTDDEGNFVIIYGMENACIILGALLHYSILSSFTWMHITAVLQFIRYVRVLGVNRPSRFMVKFTIVGWGIPLLPVITVLILQTDNYIPDSGSRVCYPTGCFLIVCVIIPIIFILIINVVLFVMVIISISRGPDGKIRAADIDLVGAQLRLSVFLFFLLGLTWLFGIFSFTQSLIWSYLFCLTSTLQGFILFIYFVILDPATRSLWYTLMKPQFTTSSFSSRKSVTSITSS